MPRALLLALGLAFVTAGCGPSDDLEPTANDPTPELADPDPEDGPFDVDPLSRQDGQTSDDTPIDPVETGGDIGDRPIEGITPGATDTLR